MENRFFCLQVPNILCSKLCDSVLWKCLWELYSPDVTLLSEQNPRSQNANVRNQFLKRLRTRKSRSLRRRRRRRKTRSRPEPPQGPAPDRRLRGNRAAGGFQNLPPALRQTTARAPWVLSSASLVPQRQSTCSKPSDISVPPGKPVLPL